MCVARSRPEGRDRAFVRPEMDAVRGAGPSALAAGRGGADPVQARRRTTARASRPRLTSAAVPGSGTTAVMLSMPSVPTTEGRREGLPVVCTAEEGMRATAVAIASKLAVDAGGSPIAIGEEMLKLEEG